jgi:N-formylglutamate deformylase
MTFDPNNWLAVIERDAPLIVAFPHTGTVIPPDIERDLASAALAVRDADWWVDRLYDFAADLGATIVRTAISRTVIDVNRDPDGASLYPGQATTELCPLATFDGEPLYHTDSAPNAAEIADRRARYFVPYHAALAAEIDRLRSAHGAVVLYEAHSIRSRVPRLFDGDLPNFNIGTNGGRSCAPALSATVAQICESSPFTAVTDGRFKGGYTTRHYGDPTVDVHAIQMELACRGYMDDPAGDVTTANWPTPYDDVRAAPMRAVLADVLKSCITFASTAGAWPR